MPKCNCSLCKYNNPRPTNSAVIIKDQKLLLAKRIKAPFAGEWDFFGGYVNAGETIEASLRREVKEELGVDCDTFYLGSFPGTASYGAETYPVLNFAYLTFLKGELQLDKNENSAFKWIPLREIKSIAFDSNIKILKFVQQKFVFDLARAKELTRQLDPTAQFKEESLYRAILEGHIEKIEENGKLIGMGWIFPRQTMLRRQAVVEDMIVDESQRGKGLGEKILKGLLKWAKDQGVEVVELTTNPKRVAANALYRKLGFKLHETNHYLLNLV